MVRTLDRPVDPSPLARSGPWTDIHCHCLPGLDDGARTLCDALALCRALVADGITTVVATPHQLGRYEGANTPPMIRRFLDALTVALADCHIPLAVHAGADIRLDERLATLLEREEVLTLAGTRYLLLEIPHEVFIDPLPVIAALAARGFRPIVTHPERQAQVARAPDRVGPWLEAGALLQITAGSVLGRFGPTAADAAWHWLETGQATLVATDAHDTASRRPCMTEAAAAISRRLGPALADRVCGDNPRRVVAGLPVDSVVASSKEAIGR